MMGRGAFALCVLALVLAGCGGESAATDTVAVSAGGDDGTAASQSDPEQASPEEGSGGGQSGRGSATLTIGEQVYTFDNYYCFEGVDNTRNDSVPFSSGAFGEIDGHRAQLDASMYDPQGRNSMEADGVSIGVSLDDVVDFENPVVSWSDSQFSADPVVAYDGATLRVEAMFDDGLTDEMEEIPGVLEAICGSG